MKISAENVVKGRLAELLVEALLQSCGNRVYRFKSQAVEQVLQEEPSMQADSETKHKLVTLPDLLVVNRRNKSVFVEVKFRSDPESLEEELLLEKDILEKFWLARIILVTTKPPHFRLLTPPYFEKAKREGWPIPVFRWTELQKDATLGVRAEKLAEFTRIFKRHFGN